MNSNTQARYAARAKIIKTMAHPTRLFIVDKLSKDGENYVCNPTEMIACRDRQPWGVRPEVNQEQTLAVCREELVP